MLKHRLAQSQHPLICSEDRSSNYYTEHIFYKFATFYILCTLKLGFGVYKRAGAVTNTTRSDNLSLPREECV
jgi:hypothetical protein